jgi:hypothetical protein
VAALPYELKQPRRDQRRFDEGEDDPPADAPPPGSGDARGIDELTGQFPDELPDQEDRERVGHHPGTEKQAPPLVVAAGKAEC